MIVKDVLDFGGLEDAQIIAGKEGLNNEVTSISVLEVAEEKIKNWVLEGQLYITSFYAILQNIEMQKTVIKALYKKRSAGLIICHIDLFLKEIHPDIIKLCDELGFPLIIANSRRSYIEILNPIILKLTENSDFKNNDVTIDMQNKLIEHIATKRDTDYVYKTMSEEYGSKMFFLDINNDIIYPKHVAESAKIVKLINDNEHLLEKEYKRKGFCTIDTEKAKKIIYPIDCNEIYYGTIVAEYEEDDIDRQIRVLRSIASLCTLMYTKSSRVEEMEIIRKQEYISDLITWNFRTDEIAVKMGQDVGWNILNKSRMIIVNLNDIQRNLEMVNKDLKKFVEEILYDRIKEIVRKNNKHNLIGLRSDIFLILLENCEKNSYENAKELGFKILECCNGSFNGSVSIGISDDIESYRGIPDAYIQATDAAKIGRHFLGDNKVVCFDDIGFYGIFRDFINMNKFNSIKNNVFRELKEYNEEGNLDLYNTLKVLIYNNMNTVKTAEQLYIHKNTVNYRKKKIIEILGYEPWKMPYLLNTVMTIVSEYFE